MKMEDWYNDGIWKCEHCEHIFKVYNLGDAEDVQGCPFCLVSGVKLIPLTEEEIEE